LNSLPILIVQFELLLKPLPEKESGRERQERGWLTGFEAQVVGCRVFVFVWWSDEGVKVFGTSV
jgi:hypothetical protein